MAKARWCYGVVPKMLLPKVPEFIRQRCSEQRRGLAGRIRKRLEVYGSTNEQFTGPYAEYSRASRRCWAPCCGR